MSNTQERLNQFILELDQQTNALLPLKNPIDQVLEEALNMKYEQLKNIHPEECVILCCKLAQYATYLQKLQNRYKNIRRWAENNLSIIVGKYGKDYGDKWLKYEERKFAIIADNQYAKALYDIWLKHGALEEELSEIANKVRYISQTIGDIKNVR